MTSSCAAFFFFYRSDFVEAALVAAAQVGRGQEDLNHFDGGFAGDDAATEREHIGIIVFACEARGIRVMGESAARMPGTLLAAMEMPMPEPQTAMPRSACFEITRSATALP